MIFTDRVNGLKIGLLLSVVASLLLLSGCSQLPSFDKAEPSTADRQDAPLATGTAAVATRQLQPNPYTLNPPTISKAARQQFQQATAAMRSRDWQTAERILLALTSTSPELSGAWLNLGLVYKQLQQPEKAIEAMIRAIDANADNINAYNQLAIVLREQGRFAEAEQHYLLAIKRWPDGAESHRNLGILYDLYMGRLSEALEQYRLCQGLLAEEDRELGAWMLDLERRLAAGGVQ